MGVTRKQSKPNFPKKQHFLPPDTQKTYVCVSGAKKCSFFGKFGELCFLVTPALRFAFLLYYRRIVHWILSGYTQEDASELTGLRNHL